MICHFEFFISLSYFQATAFEFYDLPVVSVLQNRHKFPPTPQKPQKQFFRGGGRAIYIYIYIWSDHLPTQFFSAASSFL